MSFAIIGGSDYSHCSTPETVVEEWSRRSLSESIGLFYVYALRDGDGSTFYISQGTGTRDAERRHHRKGRLGYYIREFLRDNYSVHRLKEHLTPEDAAFLEATLLQRFRSQLVNWDGYIPAGPSYDQLRNTVADFRDRARSAHRAGDSDEAILLCRAALQAAAEHESQEHQRTLTVLRENALTTLAHRVELHSYEREYVPRAPVVACEALSDLTIYLCRAGRALEAEEEIVRFIERYPHGSFVP